MKQSLVLKTYLPPLLLLLATAIWGMGFIAQKSSAAIPPVTMAACRSFFACLFLAAVIPVSDRLLRTGRRLVRRRGLDITRTEWLGGALLGVVLAVATVLQQAGMNTGTDGGKAAFITALYVVLVPLFSLLLGRRVPWLVWVSVLVATVGFYLLCVTDGWSVSPSDLLVLACSAVFAVHILLIGTFTGRCDGLRLSCVQFLSMFLVSATVALLTEPLPRADVLLSHLPGVLYLGICSSGIAYTLQILGQRGTPPAVSSVLLSLESVFGAIFGALLLGERMLPREYVGCLVVFVAVLLVELKPHAKHEGQRKKNR